MKNAILLIDGENFRKKVNEVIIAAALKPKNIDYPHIKLTRLIKAVFQQEKSINIAKTNYYAARLHPHESTLQKSRELINTQRQLKTNLEKQKVEFIFAGNVRAQETENSQVVFKEKGVDVKIAVDMTALACDKKYDMIILCSSDSDLQPAVKEATARGCSILYLGFSINPNKGLSVTAEQTILFRNSEIIEAIQKSTRLIK